MQLDTTTTYSLDDDITTDIDKSISYGISKSISCSIDKSIRHPIKSFGAYCPHLKLNKWKKWCFYTYWNNEQ